MLLRPPEEMFLPKRFIDCLMLSKLNRFYVENHFTQGNVRPFALGKSSLVQPRLMY